LVRGRDHINDHLLELASAGRLVKVAAEAPLRQIAVNAGLEGGVVVEKVKTLPEGHGLDANAGQYVDMPTAGIADPAKVTRSAPQNAALTAGLFLTTGRVPPDMPAPGERRPPVRHSGAGPGRIMSKQAARRFNPPPTWPPTPFGQGAARWLAAGPGVRAAPRMVGRLATTFRRRRCPSIQRHDQREGTPMRGIPSAGNTGPAAHAQGPADGLLALARSGDGEAFRTLVEPYRSELQVHCYRILGSVHDAEDLLQETLLAAWRGIGGYEERASIRTWLYRIATNRCLNALRSGARRSHEYVAYQPEVPLPEPSHHRAEPSWLEPYPDLLLDQIADNAAGPEARYELKESVSLAFLAALQQLPARQRAVLVLRDVLGFRAAEVADILDTTENAVTSALKRARGALANELPSQEWKSGPLPNSPEERRIVDDFVRVFEAGDVDAIVAMLTDDAWLTMPPLPLEYQGLNAIRNFLATVAMRNGLRHVLIPTRANGQPAFGCYLRDPRTPILHAHGVLVLSLTGNRIAAVTRFLDNSLLTIFGLPRSLRSKSAAYGADGRRP
jgi:RNA polymerase sigma-70 factor (ECF subfamily)